MKRKTEKQKRYNIEREQKKMDRLLQELKENPQVPISQNIRRGDIYIVQNNVHKGNEIFKTRPAVIVSNNEINKVRKVVEVVYLTTHVQFNTDTHVPIKSSEKNSMALTEQITSVSIDRLLKYCGCCTESEMKKIDNAIRKSLDIEPYCNDTIETTVVTAIENAFDVNNIQNENESMKQEIEEKNTLIVALQTELDCYKTMYEKIVNQIVKNSTDT